MVTGRAGCKARPTPQDPTARSSFGTPMPPRISGRSRWTPQWRSTSLLEGFAAQPGLGAVVDVVTRSLTCAQCREPFEARRRDAKWCSERCRNAARAPERRAQLQAAREREAADAAAAAEAHDLVRVVRSELEQAQVLGSVEGQIALQLARRALDPDGAGAAALLRELRTAVSAAKASAPREPGPPEPPDELTQARRRRDEKALNAMLGGES